MFVLIFLVLAGWTGVAFSNDQFRSRFRFRGWMIIALLPFALLGFAKGFMGIPFIFANLPIANMAMLIMLIPFCFLNIKKLGVTAAATGFILNTIARVSNNGYMPVDAQAYIKYNGNLENLSAKGIFATEIARLPLLGDWLYFPYAGGVFSPGDMLVLLGLLILVIQYQKFRYEQPRL